MHTTAHDRTSSRRGGGVKKEWLRHLVLSKEGAGCPHTLAYTLTPAIVLTPFEHLTLFLSCWRQRQLPPVLLGSLFYTHTLFSFHKGAPLTLPSTNSVGCS